MKKWPKPPLAQRRHAAFWNVQFALVFAASYAYCAFSVKVKFFANIVLKMVQLQVACQVSKGIIDKFAFENHEFSISVPQWCAKLTSVAPTRLWNMWNFKWYDSTKLTSIDFVLNFENSIKNVRFCIRRMNQIPPLLNVDIFDTVFKI